MNEINRHLQKELDLLRNQYNFPGATVAYVLSDGKMSAVACGMADIEHGQPMTTNSRMLAASIGKTFVAATMIALAKEGRLHLDDPLSNWLGGRSWFSRLPNCKTITLRHLLTHSAGLPDHVKMKGFADLFANRDLHADVPELLVGFILDHPPLFKAGEGWHYSDTGYILLGLVIETVTGSSYYDEVEQRFLKPLGLNQTSPSDQIRLDSLTAGYTPDDDLFHLPPKTVDEDGVMVWNPGIEWTGGGLISNSSDLARWAKLLYEGKALPQDYLDDLLQSVPIENGESKTSYGLGVVIEDRGAFGKRYGHGGVIPGYTSSMRYYPQYGVSIAFQINADTGMSSPSSELIADMDQRLENILIDL